jgi:hypothetical protein
VAFNEPTARVEIPRQQLPHLLRVSRLGQRGETDQVREEHRDQAALSNALRLTRRGRRRIGKRVAAFVAEQLVGVGCGTACRTRLDECSSAAAAETRTGTVLDVARRTDHLSDPAQA